jgi:hypothetical protein
MGAAEIADAGQRGVEDLDGGGGNGPAARVRGLVGREPMRGQIPSTTMFRSGK